MFFIWTGVFEQMALMSSWIPQHSQAIIPTLAQELDPVEAFGSPLPVPLMARAKCLLMVDRAKCPTTMRFLRMKDPGCHRWHPADAELEVEEESLWKPQEVKTDLLEFTGDKTLSSGHNPCPCFAHLIECFKIVYKIL